MAIDWNAIAEILGALWKNFPGIKDKLASVRKRVGSGNSYIAVFGPGGVGKSTLGILLSEGFVPAKFETDYVDTPDTSKVSLKSNSSQHIVIAPGQPERINAHWPEIRLSLTKSKNPVIINVVSWGYHTPRKDREVNAGNLEMYVEQARQEEIRIITEIANYFIQTKMEGNIKFLTLVTKQDLWWNQRDEVKAFYEAGEYNAQIEKLRSSKGTSLVPHEYVYASLIPRNMMSGDTILIPTASGFDIEIMKDSHEKLLTILEGFLK